MTADLVADFERMALGRQRRSSSDEEAIQWTDMGMLAFLKAVQNLDSTRLKIGVVGDRAEQATQHDPHLTVGELALIQEFGSGDIPARPFINGVIHPMTAMIESARVGQAVVAGQSPDQRLHEAGQKFALQLRNNLLANKNLAPNAPATIRKKGMNYPLLETAQLVEAIWYELVHDADDEVFKSGDNIESAPEDV